MRPPLAYQDLPGNLIKVTQLFGGNPAAEAYTDAGGNRIIGHAGIDIACPIGMQVYPAAAGELLIIDSGSFGYGLHAMIRNGAGDLWLYGHLSAVTQQRGSIVAPHHPFALSGSTGFSTGPHLHFGYYPKTTFIHNGYAGAVDPLGLFDADVWEHFDLSLTNL